MRERVGVWDCEELLALIVSNGDEDKAEELINADFDPDDVAFELYDTDFDTFIKLVDNLIEFTHPLKSPITEESFRALGISMGDGTFRAVVQKKAEV